MVCVNVFYGYQFYEFAMVLLRFESYLISIESVLKLLHV